MLKERYDLHCSHHSASSRPIGKSADSSGWHSSLAIVCTKVWFAVSGMSADCCEIEVVGSLDSLSDRRLSLPEADILSFSDSSLNT
jgi:hypothetical protein